MPKENELGKLDVSLMSPEQVTAELAALQLMKERLQLEVLQEQVAKMKAFKQQQLDRIHRQAATIIRNQKKREFQQNICPHKKGGKGRENILNGNAAEHSIIVQTEPWGETYVICSRCFIEVRMPFYMIRILDPVKFRELVKVDRKKYQQEVARFEKFLRLATDNTPSGTKLIDIRRDEAAA